MFLAGERCDVETLDWAKRSFGVPILDHWWQTGRTFTAPRSARRPVPALCRSGDSRTRRSAARNRVLFSFISTPFGF